MDYRVFYNKETEQRIRADLWKLFEAAHFTQEDYSLVPPFEWVEYPEEDDEWLLCRMFIVHGDVAKQFVQTIDQAIPSIESVLTPGCNPESIQKWRTEAMSRIFSDWLMMLQRANLHFMNREPFWFRSLVNMLIKHFYDKHEPDAVVQEDWMPWKSYEKSETRMREAANLTLSEVPE